MALNFGEPRFPDGVLSSEMEGLPLPFGGFPHTRLPNCVAVSRPASH